MSGGAKGGGATRVSIPSGVKKTIDNIKEFTGNNHSEDEIYAMLKECAMDPNETTQRLLLLETFHEVKRKRDRRKENPNKESADLKWKAGTQARSNRVGRVNYIARYASQDGGSGRLGTDLMERAPNYPPENPNVKAPPAASLGMKKSSSPIESSGKLGEVLPNSSPEVFSKDSDSTDAKNTKENELEQLENNEEFPFSSSSDSKDLPLSNMVGATQLDLQNTHSTSPILDDNASWSKPTSSNTSPSEIGISQLLHDNDTPNDLLTNDKDKHLDSLPTAFPTYGVSAVSRPSSNYNSQSQVAGQSKGGSVKEWKPKSSHFSGTPNVAATDLSEGSTASVEVYPESTATPLDLFPKEAISEPQRKLEDANLADRGLVVIPNYLQAPEVKKLGFCFGSFDAGFELDMSQCSVGENVKDSPALAVSTDPNNTPVNELKSGGKNSVLLSEGIEKEYSDHPESTVEASPHKFPEGDTGGPSSTIPEQTEAILEASQGIHQDPSLHTPSSHNLGFMPPIVPQSFDPAGYYAQFYRSGFIDSDGRISPFHAAGVANNYNVNTSLISSQTAQTHQELQGSVQLGLSTSPTHLVTQAAGVMRSSVTPTQQPLPIFQQPSGVPMPHYPPNFISYSPYFSPFYLPPPSIHQFLSNGVFPQQPQTGSLYPPAPGTSSKYSISQFKEGSNIGNSTHVGLPGSYGRCGISISSSLPTVTSGASDDTAVAHVKDYNVYASGQQNEGSGVWFTTPAAEIGSLPSSTYYNLPQGHHLAFNPAHAGPGAFSGIFHPAQGVATANVHPILQQSQPITSHSDMVGQTANIYKQPQQHSQPYWPSSY